MRATTAGELTTLAALTRQVTLRLKVQNGSGTMIDLTTWMERIATDDDIDRPIAALTVDFRRDHGTTLSLSPFRADSTLNRLDDGVTYSPQLDINRLVTFEAATTPIGTAPVAGDYKLLFKGTIDVVNFEKSPVSISCRDLGAPLVDRSVEAAASYGTGVPGSGVGGRAIEIVKQDILDAGFGGGAVPVYTPSSPGFSINTYQQQKQSISDAEQALDQLIGWDSRYWWDGSTSAYRYTFQNPPRSKTTPDYTFSSSGYFDFTLLNLDLTNIRNAIQVSYRDSTTHARTTVTRTDATSITKYGRRFFLMQEDDTSPIDTATEANAMADSALSDLKDPKAELEVEMPFFWPAQLWDLYRFSANAVHMNSAQDLAVVSFRHEFSANKHRTIVRLRGKPAGAYLTWLERGGTIGGAAVPPVPTITWLNTETDDSVWKFRFDAVPGTGGGGTNLTYIITSKRAAAAETTLSSGNASVFPLSLNVTRDARIEKVVRFAVTDAATGITTEDRVSIPSVRDEIDDTGAPKRGKPYDDGFRTPKGTSGGDIDGSTGHENGGSAKRPSSGRDDSPPLVHGQSRSFPNNFQNPAKIDVRGGVKYEPASVWGSSDPGTNTAFGSSAPAATAQIEEVTPISVSVSGYTMRARLRQAGTSTNRSNAFPAGAITTNGGDKQVTVASAPAFDDTYYADFTYDFESTGGHGGLDASSVSATVSLQYFNGSIWVTLGTFTDGDSDPGTAAGGFGSCGISGSGSVSGTQSGLTGSSLMRILLTTNPGSGTRTYSVDPGNLTYTTTTGEQYARTTPTGVNVLASSIGAS